MGSGKQMAIVTGLKDYSVFAASSRAVNFLEKNIKPRTRFKAPSTFNDGTNVVAYSPAVLTDSFHFTVEMAFDRFPDGLFEGNRELPRQPGVGSWRRCGSDPHLRPGVLGEGATKCLLAGIAASRRNAKHESSVQQPRKLPHHALGNGLVPASRFDQRAVEVRHDAADLGVRQRGLEV